MDVPRDELSFSFARSGGPGGQNVNKVSSKVIMRWTPAISRALRDEVKGRLLEMLRGRLTKEGELIISSQRYRDQPRNIDDCLEKLGTLIQQAAQRPKKRKPTRPTKASQQRRLDVKRRKSGVKRERRFRAEE